MSTSNSPGLEPPLLRLREAVKQYGSRRVLAMRALDLYRGDRLLVTGANGSGKSTLMRAMAGVTNLSSGSVERSDGYESLRVCFLPQAGGLNTDLTLADNLHQWMLLTGAGPLPDLARQWFIREFDLLPYLDTRCRDLSGGFQRLAALACAFATRPDGLYVDEPLAGIDTGHTKVLVEGLGAAQQTLQFLVVTSHDAGDLPSATRTLSLVDGQIEEAAT
jgi:ABC-type multidrug transport system ATPase subunit